MRPNLTPMAEQWVRALKEGAFKPLHFANYMKVGDRLTALGVIASLKGDDMTREFLSSEIWWPLGLRNGWGPMTQPVRLYWPKQAIDAMKAEGATYTHEKELGTLCEAWDCSLTRNGPPMTFKEFADFLMEHHSIVFRNN